MPLRHGRATWEGNLRDGKGTVALGSGAFEGSVSFASRFEDGKGTNPEELIGAAHAACFSMALAHILGENGYKPARIDTAAAVKIEKAGEGFKITSVELDTRGRVPGINKEEFLKYATQAKEGCPVSQALRGTEILLKSGLEE